ncbi:MAG: hypothetical protein LBQ12_12370 [Deltaproteobacteria bacterium]|jgi:hypothetical protein|nr:hypothetical protein [Deltaproteobacteria bacterium]
MAAQIVGMALMTEFCAMRQRLMTDFDVMQDADHGGALLHASVQSQKLASLFRAGFLSPPLARRTQALGFPPWFFTKASKARARSSVDWKFPPCNTVPESLPKNARTG